MGVLKNYYDNVRLFNNSQNDSEKNKDTNEKKVVDKKDNKPEKKKTIDK